MKLLDLFCGGGGAGIGYSLAGFTVVGVDNIPQPHYPFEFHQADAFEYLAEHGHEYDFIHASPPCQKYTGMRNITRARFGIVRTDHPDLIDIVRRSLRAIEKPYIIENVQNSPLQTQFILCGSALGLTHVAWHRHFESNMLFLGVPKCNHLTQDYTIGVYGEKPDGRRVSYRQYRLCRIAKSLSEAQELLGIDWMEWNEIRNAVPPAYTQWIGNKALEILAAH